MIMNLIHRSLLVIYNKIIKALSSKDIAKFNTLRKRVNNYLNKLNNSVL